MSNENNITVSKNIWFILCGTVIILLLIILYLLSICGNGDGLPTALEEAVKDKKFETAILANSDGNINIFSELGGKVSPCRNLGENQNDCGEIKGTRISQNVVVFELVKVNPICQRITTSNGNVWWYHVKGKHAGKRPCHSGNSPKHKF